MITHEEFIKKYDLFRRRKCYQKNGWLYIRNFYIYEDEKYETFFELPSKIEFTRDCNFDIKLDVEKIPPDVIFNNRGHVEIYYAEEISENVLFNNDGVLRLGDYKGPIFQILKKIHPSVKFINNGDVYLGDIIDKIPKEISFNNKGDVYAFFIENFSENVIFNNGGDIILNKPVFSKGVKFNNKGIVKENSPLKIPKFLDSKKYLNKMIEQLYK